MISRFFGQAVRVSKIASSAHVWPLHALLAKAGQACPVILDDALVCNADDDRRARMFDVLNTSVAGEDALPIALSLHSRTCSPEEPGWGPQANLMSWPQD